MSNVTEHNKCTEYFYLSENNKFTENAKSRYKKYLNSLERKVTNSESQTTWELTLIKYKLRRIFEKRRNVKKRLKKLMNDLIYAALQKLRYNLFFVINMETKEHRSKEFGLTEH